MPKDDWEKYARRDRGRKALLSGKYYRVTKQPKQRPKQRPKRRTAKKPTTHMEQPEGTIAVKHDGFTICYAGPPEVASVRYVIKGDLSKGLPPWPGFT